MKIWEEISMNGLPNEIVGKSAEITCVDNYYDCTILDIYDGWIKIDEDGSIKYINMRHIVEIEPKSDDDSQPKKRRGIFTKKDEDYYE